ncbi:MAG: hypothetical protein WCE21_02335 [Candidatus Babeliales bacterium]
MKQSISFFALSLICLSYQATMANDFYIVNSTTNELDIELTFLDGSKQHQYAPSTKNGSPTVGPLSVSNGCLKSVGTKIHGSDESYTLISNHRGSGKDDWHYYACSAKATVKIFSIYDQKNSGSHPTHVWDFVEF